jgi:hypothetical protein
LRTPEFTRALRLTTMKKAFGAQWEPFLSLANVRGVDTYGFRELISQTFIDAWPVQDRTTERLAVLFRVNDGRMFVIDLPDDMTGVYRDVLVKLMSAYADWTPDAFDKPDLYGTGVDFGTGTVTNWDQAGATWDQAGAVWGA